MNSGWSLLLLSFCLGVLVLIMIYISLRDWEKDYERRWAAMVARRKEIEARMRVLQAIDEKREGKN